MQTRKFRSRALGLKTPRRHCVMRTKKIRVPATFTIGFMDAIRMVGLRSAQPANGRIRPLAPIFMPRYASRVPMGHLQPRREVLCFQRRHLVARLHAGEKKRPLGRVKQWPMHSE